MADQEMGNQEVIVQKKGIARLWEILTRDIWDFFRANLILFAASCPGILLVVWGIWGHSLVVVLLGGVVLGILGAPFLCGLYDTLLRALRDDAGFWSLQYKQALKQDWKDALLPGIVGGVILAVWLFEASVLLEQKDLSGSALVAMLEVVFFLTGIFHYIFAQIVLVSVSAKKLYSNSIRLFVGALPYSVAAAAVQLVYWGIFYMYLPRSVPFLMISGFWFPNLLVLMILMKPLKRYLRLEE